MIVIHFLYLGNTTLKFVNGCTMFEAPMFESCFRNAKVLFSKMFFTFEKLVSFGDVLNLGYGLAI